MQPGAAFLAKRLDDPSNDNTRPIPELLRREKERIQPDLVSAERERPKWGERPASWKPSTTGRHLSMSAASGICPGGQAVLCTAKAGPL
jgi:hypothetical protein